MSHFETLDNEGLLGVKFISHVQGPKKLLRKGGAEHAESNRSQTGCV